jgi:hypothetical protein
MRKLSAFILIIPFAILLIGSMTLTSFCPTTQQESCTQTPDQCCQRQTGKPPCKKDPESDRTKDQNGDHPACCFDCPLCALITIPPFIHFDLTQPDFGTEYAVRPDNLPTDYCQPHWKPPNSARLA